MSRNHNLLAKSWNCAYKSLLFTLSQPVAIGNALTSLRQKS